MVRYKHVLMRSLLQHSFETNVGTPRLQFYRISD